MYSTNLDSARLDFRMTLFLDVSAAVCSGRKTVKRMERHAAGTVTMPRREATQKRSVTGKPETLQSYLGECLAVLRCRGKRIPAHPILKDVGSEPQEDRFQRIRGAPSGDHIPSRQRANVQRMVRNRAE